MPVRTTVGLVAGITALVACTSSSVTAGGRPGGVDHAFGLPILASELQRPGSELRDGLTVPAGAAGAGPPLPDVSRLSSPSFQRPEHEWFVTVGAGSRPRSVADALLRQAERAGFCCLPPSARCTTATCELYSSGAAPGTRGRFRGRSLSLRLVADGDHRTWGQLRVIDWGGDTAVGYVPDVNDAIEQAAPGPPAGVAPARGRLPSAGELVGFGSYRSNFTSPYHVRVEPGSVMVLPVLEEHALLRVTGDPARVFRGYERQLGRYFPSQEIRHRHVRRDGWIVDVASAETSEGTGSVERYRRGDATYLRLAFGTEEEFEP